MSTSRPAFYALAPGGWRDYVTLLHPPYTLWHLSYVAIGAGLAPVLHPGLLALTLAAFALALGVGAHALDELNGRPLRTRIPDEALVALAAVTIAAAASIGIGVAIERTFWLLSFVVFGAFIVVAYNLELFGGRFHSDTWFALAWGAFPVLTGYFASAERIAPAAVAAAASASLLSVAQRRLSTQVRTVRREVDRVDGMLVHGDGRIEPLDADSLTRVPEAALRALTAAVVALAVAVVLVHVT
jgi:hypothetical protein